MRVAILGCGLMGEKRRQALGKEHRLVVAADLVSDRAQLLARRSPGAQATTDWQEAVARDDVDAVIVSTTNDWLAPMTIAALQAKKHVLVEKPAARSPEELKRVLDAAASNSVCVQVGFNHRFHPAFQKAQTLCHSGRVGRLMFIRGRYGHGGRLGYEREWRADPVIAGGGELLDQGVHLIDLARWFLGDFTKVDGCVRTFFWDTPVEDNGFLLLRTPRNQVAWLHASCTEWKNLFSFEIYGRNAKLHIEGLGGSYGVERLSCYRMRPCMGPPETTIWEYPGEDLSWKREFQSFDRAIREQSRPSATLEDAHATLEIVDRIYRHPTL